MADTFKFQKDWYEVIMNDQYVKTSPQEMAYILYAAMQYAFNDGKPIDLGEVFGSQYGGLNRAMPNIYGQMDKIKNYEKNILIPISLCLGAFLPVCPAGHL